MLMFLFRKFSHCGFRHFTQMPCSPIRSRRVIERLVLRLPGMGLYGNSLLLPALVLALCATVLATSDVPKGVIMGTGHTVGFGELQARHARSVCFRDVGNASFRR